MFAFLFAVSSNLYGYSVPYEALSEQTLDVFISYDIQPVHMD